MKKNLSSPEGMFRLAVAAVCFSLLYFNTDLPLAVPLLAGLFFLITGIWRVCPVYAMLKISTIRPGRKP